MTPRDIARALDQAERTTSAIEPGILRGHDPWTVAEERDAIRRARGATAIGYKLGWTSAAMRAQYGIAECNYGRLFDYMDAGGQDLVDLSGLINPLVEPEIAFRPSGRLVGSDLADTPSLDGEWAVALEVVDPRWTKPFTWQDNTADGSSAARFVTGPWFTPVSDPAGWHVQLSWPGGQRSGHGAAALGSPVAAVAWLVKQLALRGDSLEPGSVVLTGGLTAPVPLVPGSPVRARSQELGTCQVKGWRREEGR